jgi:hypothetical protein
MKRSIKNFAATLIIGGIFLTPAFCLADTDKDKSENKDNIKITVVKEVITQAEVEAIEEITKIAKRSYKKMPKSQDRPDQMIAMTVINKIENFSRANIK